MAEFRALDKLASIENLENLTYGSVGESPVRTGIVLRGGMVTTVATCSARLAFSLGKVEISGPLPTNDFGLRG